MSPHLISIFTTYLFVVVVVAAVTHPSFGGSGHIYFSNENVCR